MILSDKEIRERVQQSELIVGFKESNLQSASYDITITRKISRFKNEFRRISLENSDLIDASYEEIDIGYGYDLRPGEYILVQLNEKINMPKDLAAHIRPRTTFIRLGLMLSHQHINPTYRGRLSLGLLNASPYVIQITPDLKIGQIIFEFLSQPPSEEKLYENSKGAKYQNEDKFIGSKVYQEVSDKKNLQQKYMDLIGSLTVTSNKDSNNE